MIHNILAESLFAVSIIIGFGVCGFCLLLPFAGTSRFWFLAAPFLGMLVVPFGALAFYSVADVPFERASWVAAIFCITVGVAHGLFARKIPSFSIDRFTASGLILAFAAIVAAALLACDYATLRSGGPAIVFFNGTDHGGYAQLADWLNTHTVMEAPAATADQPYASWPQMMFSIDPRFGSFGLVAIISALHGTSGFFAYDVTCAIVIAAEVLALAGLFADTLTVLALVVVGLFLSHWIDYGHIGFFGKVLGYPASLMIAGLALNSLANVSPERVLYIAVFAAAAGVVHSGPAVSLMCGCILGTALAAQFVAERDSSRLHSAAMLYGAALLAPTIASGVIARPLLLSFPDWKLDWQFQLPRMLDLEQQFDVTGLSPRELLILAVISLVIWVALIVIAFRTSSIRAVGLIAGPAVLLLVLFAANARAVAYQLIGFYYPASICGACCLLSTLSSKRPDGQPSGREPAFTLMPAAVLLLLVIAISERIPRFVGMIDVYVRHPPSDYTFYQSEFEQLSRKIGADGIVKVDIVNPERVIAALVEFGFDKLHVQWTARSWHAVLGYRPWPVPVYSARPGFLLTDATEPVPPGDVIWQSATYRLLRLSPSE